MLVEGEKQDNIVAYDFGLIITTITMIRSGQFSHITTGSSDMRKKHLKT